MQGLDFKVRGMAVSCPKIYYLAFTMLMFSEINNNDLQQSPSHGQ